MLLFDVADAVFVYHMSPVLRCLLGSVVTHYDSVHNKAMRNSPKHFEAACRLIHCLGRVSHFLHALLISCCLGHVMWFVESFCQLFSFIFNQAAAVIKISNLLICFCSFDLSCPILEKDSFIEHYCIVLSH